MIIDIPNGRRSRQSSVPALVYQLSQWPPVCVKVALGRGFPGSLPEGILRRELCPGTAAVTSVTASASTGSSRPNAASLRQGPVIYAQLDHSGGHHSDKINKSESVVYADIRKN